MGHRRHHHHHHRRLPMDSHKHPTDPHHLPMEQRLVMAQTSNLAMEHLDLLAMAMHLDHLDMEDPPMDVRLFPHGMVAMEPSLSVYLVLLVPSAWAPMA